LVAVEAAAVPPDQPVEVIETASLMSLEQLDELFVQGDVSVVVELADR
jgi:hypothetical protein